jgi:hypothetical protein
MTSQGTYSMVCPVVTKEVSGATDCQNEYGKLLIARAKTKKTINLFIKGNIENIIYIYSKK